MSDFVHSWWGLTYSAFSTVIKPLRKINSLWDFHYYPALLLSGIQAMLLVIILCPVSVLYVFGIYISAGFGLWRLIQHDFGNVYESANLKPALQVLYSLAAAQGFLYGYKTLHAFGAKVALAEFVAEDILSMDKDLVTAYLKETVTGCEKDPSFATGRNLVTYCMDLLINAKSNDGFIAGVKVLGEAIKQAEYHLEPDRKLLAKHLLTRPSSPFNHLIQRLLETLGPRSPYSGKIRAQAASIVGLVASSIDLEEHPEWIHYILCMLETYEEYSWQPKDYERDSRIPNEYEQAWLLEEHEQQHFIFFYKRTESGVETSSTATSDQEGGANYIRLVGQGFNTLQRLTANNPKNSRVIVNIEGLLAKMITALINSKQLHSNNQHDLWSIMVEEYFKLMTQLAATPGEKGIKVLDKISRCSEEIMVTVESILDCLECDMVPKISAVVSILDLSVDTSSMKASRSSQIFTWFLLLIFSLAGELARSHNSSRCPNMISRNTSRLAGEKKLSLNQELPLQQSVGYVLGDLIAGLVSAQDISTRIHAAKILEVLVCSYDKEEEDEFLKDLKKGMVSVMPEVLKEMFGDGSLTGEDTDVEMGGVSGRGEVCDQTSSSRQQTGDEMKDIKLRLQRELRKLCRTIKMWWHQQDPDVKRQLDAIAGEDFGELVDSSKNYTRLIPSYLSCCSSLVQI